MTSYVLGVLSAIIVRTIKTSFASSPPLRFEHTHPTLPTAQRICSSPIPQIQVQATIGLRPTAPREIKYQLEMEKCPVELTTVVQPPPRTNHGETKVEDIMQEVERLLSLDGVEKLTYHFDSEELIRNSPKNQVVTAWHRFCFNPCQDRNDYGRIST